MTPSQILLGLAILVERSVVILYDLAGPGQRTGFLQIRWFWPLTVFEALLTAGFLVPHWWICASWIEYILIFNGAIWWWLIGFGQDINVGGGEYRSKADLAQFGRSYLWTFLFKMVRNMDLLLLAMLIEALERRTR